MEQPFSELTWKALNVQKKKSNWIFCFNKFFFYCAEVTTKKKYENLNDRINFLIVTRTRPNMWLEYSHGISSVINSICCHNVEVVWTINKFLHSNYWNMDYDVTNQTQFFGFSSENSKNLLIGHDNETQFVLTWKPI